MTVLKRDNHYVPRSYLKRWAGQDGKLSSYRVLVSHANVPLWKRVSPGSIAYHEHLYTRIAAAGESDDLERWLDAEFEAPAEEAIEKVVTQRALTRSDWRRLARFFAAQDVRTPARLAENLARWSASLPQVIRDSLSESIANLEGAHERQRYAPHHLPVLPGPVPFRVTIEKNENSAGGRLTAETVVGRALWVWSIRYLLTYSIRVLYNHRWTILSPPRGSQWLTSDDPVLKLNFNTLNDYSFGGGWANSGTDLLLPLGPKHLLFTQVGRPVPPRGTVMDSAKADLVRRFTVEHAHRHIFAAEADPSVPLVRPRHINAAVLKDEADQWRRWHDDQSAAERGLLE
jgi:hypothetical protein